MRSAAAAVLGLGLSVAQAAPQDILAFGDSLTFGKGAARSESYPAVLSGLTGRRVFNEGISGETSGVALARLPGVLARTQPGVVVLLSGGNDMLRRLPEEQMLSNVDRMVELSQAAGARVLLIAVPTLTPTGLAANPGFSEIAKARGVPLDNKLLPSLLSDPLLLSDQVHPNAAGYLYMARRIFRVLGVAGLLDDEAANETIPLTSALAR